MRFTVAHTTTYHYDQPVTLDPHVVLLRPRCDGSQTLSAFELNWDPAPVGMSQILDQNGNVCTQAWFSGLTEELRISSRFEVETLRSNAYDFLLPPEPALVLPFIYPEPLRSALVPYRNSDDGPAAEMAARIAQESGNRAMRFLELATWRIFSEFRHEQRLEGGAFTAGETIASGEGSCRDFAVLLASLCRSVGLAARFVSGYEQASAGEHHPHMHAWTEVYLPGGGWRAYDPSRGGAVSTGHVAVAAAADPELAAPISGGFRGAAKQQMEIAISMRLE